LTTSPSPLLAAREISPPANRFHDRQAELGGEVPVPVIAAGHGHDGAGAVADQHDLVGE